MESSEMKGKLEQNEKICLGNDESFNNEKTVGMRIRMCRKLMGITQEDLGEKLYIDKRTISDYERDKINLRIDILKELAGILGTTVSYLAEGEERADCVELEQMMILFNNMETKELREVALEQIKALNRLNK